MYIKKMLTIFLTVLIVLFISACGLMPEEEVFRTTTIVKEYEGTEFNMTTVKRGDIRDYRNIPCEFNQSNIENINIPSWLTIKKVCVKEGDKVKAGDILVELESEEEGVDIEEIKYEIARQKKIISQARRMCELEVKKQKLILNEEVSIKAIKENYDAQISSYENELLSLKQKLDDAVQEQNEYLIRASISGTVTYADASAAGAKKMNIAGPNGRPDMKQDVNVVSVSDGGMPFFSAAIDSSEYIDYLSEGQEIKVTCLDREYNTKVHFPKDNKSEVYFTLDYVPDDIYDGNIANAEYVIEEHKNVLYLPDISVNKMGDSYVVYYEDENGLKNAKEVTIGLKAENKIEITGGLEFGDAVIVR